MELSRVAYLRCKLHGSRAIIPAGVLFKKVKRVEKSMLRDGIIIFSSTLSSGCIFLLFSLLFFHQEILSVSHERNLRVQRDLINSLIVAIIQESGLLKEDIKPLG